MWRKRQERIPPSTDPAVIAAREAIQARDLAHTQRELTSRQEHIKKVAEQLMTIVVYGEENNFPGIQLFLRGAYTRQATEVAGWVITEKNMSDGGKSPGVTSYTVLTAHVGEIGEAQRSNSVSHGDLPVLSGTVSPEAYLADPSLPPTRMDRDIIALAHRIGAPVLLEKTQ